MSRRGLEVRPCLAQQPKYAVPPLPEVFQKFPYSGHTAMVPVVYPPLPYTFLPSSLPCFLPLRLFSSPLPQDTVFEEPVRRLSEEELEEMGLRYYDSDVHKGSFTLPRFARKVDTLTVASTTCYKLS